MRKKFFSIVGTLFLTAILAACAGEGGRGVNLGLGVNDCDRAPSGVDLSLGGPKSPCGGRQTFNLPNQPPLPYTSQYAPASYTSNPARPLTPEEMQLFSRRANEMLGGGQQEYVPGATANNPCVKGGRPIKTVPDPATGFVHVRCQVGP